MANQRIEIALPSSQRAKSLVWARKSSRSRLIERTVICTLLLSSAKPAAAESLDSAPLTREEFRDRWYETGKRMAEARGWIRPGTISLLVAADVKPGVSDQVASALRDQLAELNSTHFLIDPVQRAMPDALKSCTANEVLSFPCVKRTVEELRAGPGNFPQGIVVLITPDAIETDPDRDITPFQITSIHGKTPFVKSVPPSGVGSSETGVMIVSELWRRVNQPGRSDDHPGSSVSVGRDKTARHELLHVFGLPHHAGLVNPAFPKPLLCTECHESKPPHTDSPHPECILVCGGAADNWQHFRQHGRTYGLCQACEAAAHSILAGIEGRPLPPLR